MLRSVAYVGSQPKGLTNWYFYTVFSVKDLPGKAKLSANKCLSRSASLREIVAASADSSRDGEVRTTGKGSSGRCTRRTPPPCTLRTTSFEARYTPASGTQTNFAPVGGRDQATPRGCGWVPFPSGRVQVGGFHPQARNYKRSLLSRSPPSQLVCLRGKQKPWYQRTWKPSLDSHRQRKLRAGPDLLPIHKNPEQEL